MHNPSLKPVIVQLIPLALYPGASDLVEKLRDEFGPVLTDPVEFEDLEMFSLLDSEVYNVIFHFQTYLMSNLFIFREKNTVESP